MMPNPQSPPRSARRPMPALAKPKYELFAQGLASGLSADAAYQAAGYKPNRGNAATLKANQSIIKRVEELLSKKEVVALLTLEEHMGELKSLRELAKENNQT